jgi:phosphoglycerol transferase MdoB-like AlkP superfamily enzyme
MKNLDHIKLLLRTYVLGIVVFFFFRFVLFITELDKAGSFPGNLTDIIRAFVTGVRFDLVISGYIMLLPFMVVSVLYLFNLKAGFIYQLLFYTVFILYMISFVICAADIPYFDQFLSRFSVEAFQWMDTPKVVLQMILQEPRYYLIIIPLIILAVIFYRFLRTIFKPLKHGLLTRGNYILIIAVTLISLALIFIGIRGHAQKKKPIRVETASFGDNPFLNQLGLNPVFTLIVSYLDSHDESKRPVSYMDSDKAILQIQKYLNIHTPVPGMPIARLVSPDTVSNARPNVVLIIMESMSTAKMARYGNIKNLTPFLDSIANHSLYFENIYTAGKHTFNGIFGTYFSFPSIYKQHPMKDYGLMKYNGIAGTLKGLGYSTTYFTTHRGEFDNAESFLKANDFENIFTQRNYPEKEIKTAWGVPDDYLFRFAIPVIDSLYQVNKPFFVSLVTVSDHAPFYIPEYFRPRNREEKDQVVEYADWSMKQFIVAASEKKWFDSTLFVFIADHGSPVSYKYDISLDYHHTPLVIYAPYILKESRVYSCIGGQIDVFPTLMGILKQSYLNNTMGIDLLSEKRPYILINDDDKFGVLNNEYMLIRKSNGTSHLYDYKSGRKTDYRESNPEQAKDMEEYGKVHLQVFQDMLIRKQTYADPLLFIHQVPDPGKRLSSQ